MFIKKIDIKYKYILNIIFLINKKIFAIAKNFHLFMFSYHSIRKNLLQQLKSLIYIKFLIFNRKIGF